MPKFEKLLMAVTGKGRWTPSHFRNWAESYEKGFGVIGVPFVEWLNELADTLEEIYAEVIEKYEEE